MPTTRGRVLAAIAATAVTALALTACSSSGSGGKSTGTSGSSTAEPAASSGPAPSGTPVKIGLVVGLAGTEATMMKSVPDVAKAWASATNAAGGVAGHPVTIVVKDSKGDPAQYQSALKDLVEQDKVSAIVSSDDVSEATGGAYLQSKNIPVIGGTGTDVSIWGARPNYYQLQTSIPATLLAQASLAKGVGAKSFGTIVCAEVSACLQAQGLFKPAAEALGLKWTGIVTAAASAPNYTAQCLSLIQKKTDFISLALQTSIGIRLIPDCVQQNFTGTIGVNAQAFVQSQQEKLSGAHLAVNLQAFPWWVDAAPVQAFRAAMQKYAPNADYRSGVDTVTWATLELFKKALTGTSGDITPAVVTAAYSKIKNETLDGLLPQPMTFTAGKAQPKVNCYWPITYTPGDKNPKVLQIGKSGNGASGDLSSSCVSTG